MRTACCDRWQRTVNMVLSARFSVNHRRAFLASRFSLLASRFSLLATPSSDGIHKRLFGAVEDDDAENKGNDREDSGVGQPGDGRTAGTEKAVFESFDDVADRVPLVDRLQPIRHQGGRHECGRHEGDREQQQ